MRPLLVALQSFPCFRGEWSASTGTGRFYEDSEAVLALRHLVEDRQRFSVTQLLPIMIENIPEGEQEIRRRSCNVDDTRKGPTEQSELRVIDCCPPHETRDCWRILIE